MTDYFPLQSLIEFARNKPVDETYNFSDAENCPLAQFGKFALQRDDVLGGTCSFLVKAIDKRYFFQAADGGYPWNMYEVLGESQNWGQLAEALHAVNIHAVPQPAY